MMPGPRFIEFRGLKFITGQNEREETTQDAIVTKSAAFASYEINYLTYITATYTRAKRRWHGATAHAPRFLHVKKVLSVHQLSVRVKNEYARRSTKIRTPWSWYLWACSLVLRSVDACKSQICAHGSSWFPPKTEPVLFRFLQTVMIKKYGLKWVAWTSQQGHLKSDMEPDLWGSTRVRLKSVTPRPEKRLLLWRSEQVAQINFAPHCVQRCRLFPPKICTYIHTWRSVYINLDRPPTTGLWRRLKFTTVCWPTGMLKALANNPALWGHVAVGHVSKFYARCCGFFLAICSCRAHVHTLCMNTYICQVSA